jgi:beta-1,2-mannobiose phosphorylase / 1,2-beta-oligomannan phosphorylase
VNRIFSWLGRVFPDFSLRGGKTKTSKAKHSKYGKKTASLPKRPRRIAVRGKKAAAPKGGKPVAVAPPSHQLARAASNPILAPHELNDWESQAAFNPAAIVADGKVHLIYRAIGKDNVSVLGYAMTYDGTHIDERHGSPAYFMRRSSDEQKSGEPLDYLSGGGGNGGCEDPRLTVIGDTVFLTYTLFNGWNSIRIALNTIRLDDFLAKRWRWSKPALISKAGEVNKNWVLFPEKIRGRLALLTNICPEVDVAYFSSVKELKEQAPKLTKKWDISARPGWDTWVRGAGPPPLKTKYGWLVLYHAIERKHPGKYKLGAMILDARDPEKILYRSRAPILSPDELYENCGLKPGIIYSCGAVVVKGKLLVYYGGADTVSCVAAADLDSFLKELISGGTPKVRGAAKPKGKTYDRGQTL